MDFLEALAKRILSENGPIMKDVWVVLPGKRAGTFLKRQFAQQSNEPLWIPRILGINDFVEALSPVPVVDKIDLLFEFYSVYARVTESSETFDQFAQWAPTLLSDFDDIDRYLVDPKQIFINLKSVKDLENWDIDDWSFAYHDLKPAQQQFHTFWEKLPGLYRELDDALAKRNVCRSGQAYRHLSDEIGNLEIPFEKIYFAGLNALSPSEIKMIKELISLEKASVHWDVHEHVLTNPYHEAGHFLRPNLEQIKSNPEDILREELDTPIHIHNAPNAFSQSALAASLLSSGDDERTALIMCDEGLLESIQLNLPHLDKAPNITAELPITKTKVHHLFLTLVQLNIKYLASQKPVYFKDLLQVIQHPAFPVFMGSGINVGRAIKLINRRNFIFVGPKGFEVLFEEHASAVSHLFHMTDDLGNVQTFLSNCLALIDRAKSTSPGMKMINHQLFEEARMVNKLKTFIADTSIAFSLNTLLYFFRLIMREHSLAYKGEPLSGVQIMGMLETRSLNFDKVIMIGANEGTLPLQGDFSTFIPHDLRNYFKLPGRKNREALQAYHFYRHLWRCREVHLIYNSDTSGHDPGEPSRYIRQLKYERDFTNVAQHQTGFEIGGTQRPVFVRKDDYVMTLLKDYLKSGLSPSAINKSLNCELDFFHRYVLRLSEIEEAEEDMKEATFGSIMHNALEGFYEGPVESQGFLSPNDYQDLPGRLKTLLKAEFEKVFGSTQQLKGRNRIALNVSYHYLFNFLNTELARVKSGDKIRILFQEKDFLEPLPCEGAGVNIKGRIDRIDEYNGQVRILDYKSGAVTPLSDLTPEDAFSRNDKGKELQLLVYSWLYYRWTSDTNFIPGILYLRQPGQVQLQRMATDADLMTEVENCLTALVQNWLNTEEPWRESPNPRFETLLGYPH